MRAYGEAALLVGDDILRGAELRESGETVTIDPTRHHILAPLEPPLILGTGLNYKQHAIECGLAPPPHPVLAFFKPPAAVQHPGLPIEVPACVDQERAPEIDWEVELAVVIGRAADGAPCRDVSAADALKHVLGYTVANDVSARLWQTDPARTAGQWSKGKGFDTFCPLGPALVLSGHGGFDPHALPLSLRVNGETMQASCTSDLIHRVPEIVAFLSLGTTLAPGTVVLTGTPEGIGMFAQPAPRYLRHGDEVEASIQGIGTLVNGVRDPRRRPRASRPTGTRDMSTAAARIPGPRSAAEFNAMTARHKGNQLAIYREQHETYGEVMLLGEDVVGTDIVTLFHPDDIEAVLRQEGKMPRGLGQALLPFARFYKEHAPEGLNLGRIDGPKWLKLRKAMNKPMMSPKAAQSYLPHLARVMPACSAHLAAHGASLPEYVPLMTFEMICSVLLDKQPGIVAGEASELDKRFVETSKRVFPAMAQLMSPDEMPTFLAGESALYTEEFEPTMLAIMEMGGEYITDLRARLAAAADEPDDPVHTCYFAQIIAMDVLDDHQMNINFSNLIFAGVDTTSNVVQWMLWHLARNPRVQEKMRAEAQGVLGGRDVEAADYGKLRYARRVMKESYRLSPPVFGTARYLENDFEVRGHTIGAGTMIRLHPLPYLAHPDVWARPDEFVPERWTKDRDEGAGELSEEERASSAGCPMGKLAEHRFLDVVPFSIGKRMCLGARLAEAEVVSMFSRFLQDYEIELAPGSPDPIPVFKMGMIEPDPSPHYVFKPLPKK